MESCSYKNIPSLDSNTLVPGLAKRICKCNRRYEVIYTTAPYYLDIAHLKMKWKKS